MKSVKIRTVYAPSLPLTEFDPGAFLGALEFYETDEEITEEERDGLAQLVHFIGFLALSGASVYWDTSRVRSQSSAYRALEDHFGHLPDWMSLVEETEGILYGDLVRALFHHYPPHLPRKSSSASE